jgi:triacylglycerol lipase
LTASDKEVRLVPQLPSIPGIPSFLREGRTGLELAALLRDPLYRRPHPDAGSARPVLMIPGYLAGDRSLALLAGWLRRAGWSVAGSGMRANVNCATAALGLLEERAGRLADAHGERIALVGHSHGGTLARSLGQRRPDLVCGVVTLGTGLVDPLAIHRLARAHVRLLGALGSLGAPGLLRGDCITGRCCEEVRRAATRPFPDGVGLVSVYSRRDGLVDWSACLDPAADHVEIDASHIGMAFNAAAYRAVGEALQGFAAGARDGRALASAAT